MVIDQSILFKVYFASVFERENQRSVSYNAFVSSPIGELFIIQSDCHIDNVRESKPEPRWFKFPDLPYSFLRVDNSAAVYQKYLTKLGELIIFEPWRENYHVSQSRWIYLISGNTIYVFYLSFNV